MTVLEGSRFSPDRRWWWTGATWTSVTSGDGRWRWDGHRWRLIRPGWVTFLIATGLAALVLGGLAFGAGGYERHLAREPLPPGWQSYQPFWADPAYSIGRLLLGVGLAVSVMAFGILLVRSRAARTRPAPLD